jgi:copper(I)-binding protein
MKNIYLFCLLLLCSFICFFGQANPVSEKQYSTLSVEQAYIRATIPGASNSSAYMVIENTGEKTITLLSASSKVSPRIEIHEHTMADGMMRMRKLNSIDIKPKERVKLQPSGLHLMVFDVKTPLKAQQQVELTLNFSNNESVSVQVPVYSPIQEQAAQKSMPKMHEHHH